MVNCFKKWTFGKPVSLDECEQYTKYTYDLYAIYSYSLPEATFCTAKVHQNLYTTILEEAYNNLT